MINKCSNIIDLTSFLDSSNYISHLKENETVLIKINLARPPEPEHPRTDAEILNNVVTYFINKGCVCAVAECADGYLDDNLKSIGLESLTKDPRVRILDLDKEEADRVTINGEEHYVPKCLKEYKLRIAIPAASKRPNAIFSNNVKLFVGAVPRKMYQIGETVCWRPRIHIDLHKSVANVYRAIMEYAPFHLFINGGKAMQENYGEFDFDAILVGDNGLELDKYIADNIFKIERPDYINILSDFV
ncbi:MAG: DUF362 domain-containing protein [Bacillota bacterium]